MTDELLNTICEATVLATKEGYRDAAKRLRAVMNEIDGTDPADDLYQTMVRIGATKLTSVQKVADEYGLDVDECLPHLNRLVLDGRVVAKFKVK